MVRLGVCTFQLLCPVLFVSHTPQSAGNIIVLGILMLSLLFRYRTLSPDGRSGAEAGK
jgi:uncharacterized membrane protein